MKNHFQEGIETITNFSFGFFLDFRDFWAIWASQRRPMVTQRVPRGPQKVPQGRDTRDPFLEFFGIWVPKGDF